MNSEFSKPTVDTESSPHKEKMRRQDAKNSFLPRQIENPILEAVDLNLYYGDNHALTDCSVRFPANKVTALIGPSGCGKSTFLRCFNRMNDVIPGVRTQGRVIVEGRDINVPTLNLEQLRKQVGMVFQRSNPFPTSIFANITFGPKLHGSHTKAELEEICETALKQADLWREVKDRLHTSAMSLSGGQQQRLCIARTLANKPEIILMDEPASALDPISTSKIEDLILELKERYTIIIVTHNMQQAGRISDYTAFFLNGEIVEFNTTEQLFRKPDKELTENYITGRFG